MEDLTSILSQNKKDLDKIVLEFLPDKHPSGQISSLYEMMRDYPKRGGKGLRGSLCLLWCQLFDGDRQKALITAAALEVFQNWILIHDDIEDESDLRRGQPALHRMHGIPLSINAGDALHGKMWELLLSNRESLGCELCLRILSEFSMMLNQTTEGQQMELSWTVNGKWDITERDYLLMVTKKSAWYTCISPSRIGITLSRVGSDFRGLDNLTEIMVSLGTNLGIAFQIIDDVLNLTAQPDKYGKEILGDLFEGKRTLMLIHLLQNCSQVELNATISILSKPRQRKSKEEILHIFDLMKSYGSVEYARSEAKKYSESALKQFDKLVSKFGVGSSEYCATLRLLMEYLTKRDY